MMNKVRVKIGFIYGPGQTPSDMDFHITPCLTFSYEIVKDLGRADGIAIEWGYWAIVVGLYRVY